MLVELCPGGPRLSPVVVGVWRLHSWGWSAPQRLDWINACLDKGLSSFDHADIYGDYAVQALFGEALALQPGLRQRLQLVSKCGIQLVSGARPEHRVKSYNTSAQHIRASVERGLRELHTDWLDVLLIHRPDPLMQAQEVARCVERLQQDGLVRHVGVSNFTPSQFELIDSALPRGTVLCTNQIELHPLQRGPLHDGTLDQAQRLQRRPMIWSPLAGGRLVQPGPGDDAAWRVHHVLTRLAEQWSCSPATLAYAWLLRHPSQPLPVTGTRRLDALDDALAALNISLDSQTWAEIWQAGAGQELP
ncbi:MAG: aldo/keto reductase [Rubrivivax sp.]